MIGHFGRIDILVNNAAWNIDIPFTELDALTPEIWDRVLETNLRGPFLLSRAFASALRRHKAGRIINIASLAGVAPGGINIDYAASKVALIHLTHCLAVAFAPDVTVNCIAPGLVEGTRETTLTPEDFVRDGKPIRSLQMSLLMRLERTSTPELIEHLKDAVASRNLAKVEAVRLEFSRRADRDELSVPFRTTFGRLEFPQAVAARRTVGRIASLSAFGEERFTATTTGRPNPAARMTAARLAAA